MILVISTTCLNKSQQRGFSEVHAVDGLLFLLVQEFFWNVAAILGNFL